MKTFRNCLFTATILVLLLATAWARESNHTLTEKERQWLAKHKVLRLGVGTAFPPFQWVEQKDGKQVFKGIASDYAKILERHLGVEMRVVFGITFNEALARGQSGKIDIFPCVSKSPERAEFLTFTKPYLSYPLVIITRQDAPFMEGLEDLDGKQLAVVKHLAIYNRLTKDYPHLDINFIGTRSPAWNLKTVSLGQADACIINLAAAHYIIQHMGLTNLKIAAPVDWQAMQLGMGVRKGMEPLLPIIQKALDSIPQAEKDRIAQRWIYLPPERGIDMDVIWRWVVGLGLGVGTLLTIFFLWNRRLKKEVKERKRAEEAAATANRAKSEFLANMSHELRTPLNGIIGMTRLAQETNPTPETKELLDMVLQSSAHLLRMVNDILDLAAIEVGHMELTKNAFPLRSNLEPLFRTLAVQARLKKLEFDFTVQEGLPDLYLGDARKLKQVLINIIGNAVKFTEQGGIEVDVRLSDQQKKKSGRPSPRPWTTLLFSIRDTGVGVAADKQKNIFDSFTMGEDYLTREFSGTGMGLSISKQLVELMGGKIWLESEPGKGSVFHFTITFKQLKDAAPSRPLEVTPRPQAVTEHPLKILLVEDEPVSLLLAKRILKKQGHTVTTATNGEECLEALAKEPFDVVVMDIQMPKLNGLEATRKIRSGQVPGINHLVPIIALTAYAMENERERGLDAGIDDYLVKPCDLSTLVNALSRVTSRN